MKYQNNFFVFIINYIQISTPTHVKHIIKSYVVKSVSSLPSQKYKQSEIQYNEKPDKYLNVQKTTNDFK